MRRSSEANISFFSGPALWCWSECSECVWCGGKVTTCQMTSLRSLETPETGAARDGWHKIETKRTVDFDKSLNAFYFLQTSSALLNLAWRDEEFDKIRFNPPELKTIKQSQMVSATVSELHTTVAKPEISTWNCRAENVVFLFSDFSANSKERCRYRATDWWSSTLFYYHFPLHS